MGMVMEDQQTFKCLMNHLSKAFQSWETVSELISNFYSRAQKKNETEDVFTGYPKIHIQKIIFHKPSFRVEVNEQLKH